MSSFEFLKNGNRPDPLLAIEDAEIFFNNFSGIEKMNNPAGKRNFCVYVDEKTADSLSANDWNVKQTKDEDPRPYIPVEVSYRVPQLAPHIELKLSNGKVKILTEDQLEELDKIEIVYADIVIRPRRWTDRDGTEKIKAYAKELYFQKAAPAFGGRYESAPEPMPFD